MKHLLLLIALIIEIDSILLAGTYGGGSGTQGDPYIIATPSHLSELSTTTADWASGKYFNQTANITLSSS